MSPAADDPILSQLQADLTLFHPIRTRFRTAGMARGGHERVGFTPIYARLAGAHAAAMQGGAQRYVVESSFSPPQLARVQSCLVVLRRAVTGELDGTDLATRVVHHYLHETRPAFLPALLRACEATLQVLVDHHPEQAVVLDAIFRVAGSEGFRDLICFFCAHLLEQAIARSSVPFPDITAFADVHERHGRDATGQRLTTRYEVWCPGTDLAKLMDAQIRRAAATLVQEHGVYFALTTREEAALLPHRLPAYLTDCMQGMVEASLDRYGLCYD
jgi:hypothetical protein